MFVKSLVSICVPTYNGAQYIRDCVESALGQSYDNLEIVVVDDHSKDETRSIVEEYAGRDSRVRVFVNEANLGLVSNWNRCVELSRGEWIKFVLQDDFIEPECVAKMVAAPDTSSAFRVCRRRFLFDGVGPEVEKLYDPYHATWSMEKIFPGLTEISAKSLCNAIRKCGTVNFIGEPTAVLINRKMFQRFGGFNRNLVQLCDLEYWLRIGVNVGLTYIPETLATFRVHSQSATSTGRSGAFFRTRVIDPLLLMYEFAYNPLFKPLRKGHLGYQVVKTYQSLAEAAYSARTTVARSSCNCSTQSVELTEWNNLVREYPLLDRLLYFRVIEMREHLGRYLWRFRGVGASS
jgi:glycosyltransferase involved in cell wall biosynthesis